VSWGALRKNAEDAMRPLPEGTVVIAIVEKAEYVKASTGSDMIKIEAAITEGPHKPRKVFNNFVLSPDNSFAMNMFFANLGAFGVTAEVFAQLENVPGDVVTHLKIIAPSLVGRKIQITMGKPRAYQGVERDNPVAFEAIPGQPPITLNPAAAAAGSTGAGDVAAAPPSLAGVGNQGGPPPVPQF
jgi:hypothetical protein